MKGDSAYQHILKRNGTKQKQRHSRALAPSFFQVDERSLTDLIAIAQKHAEVLRYFNQDDEQQGYWTAFLSGDPQEMAAFIENPDAFDRFPEKKQRYSRPHLVLFFTFLKLLREAQLHLNDIPHRQLDFFYKTALKATPLPGHPDQVHLLAKIADDEEQVLIPAGTLLDAGEDGQGNAMIYRTDADLVANHAQVAQLKSLFVETEITDFAKARLHDPPEERFLEALRLVYHQPAAPDKMRLYPDAKTGKAPFGQEHITQLDTLEQTITDNFNLRVATFRRIIAEYEEWTDEKRCKQINDYLRSVKRGLSIRDKRDFDANFKNAYGFDINGKKDKNKPESVFDVLSGIDDLYDFYRDLHYLTQESQDKDLEIEKTRLIHFLKDKLHGRDDVDAFLTFMENRLFILSRQEAIELQLKHVSVFSQNIETVHPNISYQRDKTLANAFQTILNLPARNDAFYLAYGQQLKELENYFLLEVEDYFYIRDLYQKDRNDVFDWQWKKADELLRTAFQKLQARDDSGLLPERPEIIHWRNMYSIPDTSKFKSLPGSDRWKLFGGKPLEHTDEKVVREASFGWVFCSPHLALSEGERIVTITFKFSQDLSGLNYPDLPFDLALTTAKDWVRYPPDWQTAGSSEIKLVITIPEKDEAIAPLEKPSHPLPYPALRILPKAEKRGVFYEVFRGRQLTGLDITIDVKGLRSLEIQTPEGPQKPQKPFHPFGSTPETEAALLIFHEELLKGHLDSLSIYLDWKNLPPYGLDVHYHHYHDLGVEIGIPEIDDTSFKGKLNWVDRQKRLNLLPETNLFPGVKKTVIKDESPETVDFTVQTSAIEGNSFEGRQVIFQANGINSKLAGKTQVKPSIPAHSADLIERERFLEVVLSPQDFLHDQYSTLQQLQAKKRSDELSAFQGELYKFNQEQARKEKDSPPDDSSPPPALDTSSPAFAVLNEPFSPKLKSISVDYRAQIHIDWTAPDNLAEDFCYHLEPFGYYQPQPGVQGIPFLPNYDAAGTCYVGLSGLKPPQDISFLFEMAAGTANPDYEPSKVQWSYLSEETWKPISRTTQTDRSQARLLSDTTNGLSNSGLIRIYFPEDATAAEHRMPSGLHWLRLRVGQRVASLCDALLVATQGLLATWVDPQTPSDHLDAPLPKESITEPIEPLPGLEELTQPYASFGGRQPEADHFLYTRFSERLRHKGRALSMWDYERLVLTHFPEVYLAKAYPGDFGAGEFVPGKVNVVVLPDISKNILFDPFEPKLAVARLRAIADFLRQRAPVFAQVEVQNPRYCYLTVEVAVRFRDENLFNFYSQQLQEELSAFISPWLFDQYADISLGGRISYHAIVNFIEHRPYVDYIAHPELTLQKRNADGKLEEIKRQTQKKVDDIIIEAPDRVVVATAQHLIKPLDESKEVSVVEKSNGDRE